MATVAAPVFPRIKGGAFVVEDRTAQDIFTPEDFTDEHHQIAKTADDFVTNEVVPHAEHLEHKDYEMMRSLLRKAGELGLLSMDTGPHRLFPEAPETFQQSRDTDGTSGG